MEWVNKIINMVFGYKRVEYFTVKLRLLVSITPELIDRFEVLKNEGVIQQYRVLDDCSCVVGLYEGKTDTKEFVESIDADIMAQTRCYSLREWYEPSCEIE